MSRNEPDTPLDELVPSKSKYMSKEDAGLDGMVVTIRAFRTETIKSNDGPDEDKMVMHFEEEDVKPLILNKTNVNLLKVATGANTTSEAIGKEIVVYNDPNVSFGTKLTGGVRIRSARKVAPPRKAGKPLPAADTPQGGLDSDAGEGDVPFAGGSRTASRGSHASAATSRARTDDDCEGRLDEWDAIGALSLRLG